MFRIVTLFVVLFLCFGSRLYADNRGQWRGPMGKGFHAGDTTDRMKHEQKRKMEGRDPGPTIGIAGCLRPKSPYCHFTPNFERF